MGIRYGGREKGTPNKATQDVIEKLANLNCDPVTGMVKLAHGEALCGGCEKTGRVTIAKFYQLIGSKLPASITDDPEDLDAKTTTEITCPLCGGSGHEYVPVKVRGDMFKELLQYVAPKRKSIEVQPGADGILDALAEKSGEKIAAAFLKSAKRKK